MHAINVSNKRANHILRDMHHEQNRPHIDFFNQSTACQFQKVQAGQDSRWWCVLVIGVICWVFIEASMVFMETDWQTSCFPHRTLIGWLAGDNRLE